MQDSPSTLQIPEEEDVQGVEREEQYHALLRRLNTVSVKKKFEAYVDIPWDDPEYALDVEDPRYIMRDGNPLGQTAWYRALPEATRARIGVNMVASFMKIGLQFESVLKRGLLEFAMDLPNGSPEFRYAYHEVIEEAQHSLMFQEFVNRTGLDVTGLSPTVKWASRRIAGLGRSFPELFFLFVLGGEDPIDHQQRVMLSEKASEMPPLLRRINQIHITEEARHLSFARAYLRRHVPKLPIHQMVQLKLRAPLILRNMSRFMMQPSPEIVKRYAIPQSALDEAYKGNRTYRLAVHAALAKVVGLCRELDLIRAPFDRIWYQSGLAPHPRHS